jgi:hypothetical protein
MVLFLGGSRRLEFLPHAQRAAQQAVVQVVFGFHFAAGAVAHNFSVRFIQ